MDKSRFGTFVNLLRKEKGITQKELAEILHVTDKAVSRWETGKSYPDIEVMQQIAVYFDVTVNELFQGERIPEENIKTVTDRNVVNAFKRIKKDKNRYEAIVAILAAVIVILGCLLYPVVDAWLNGEKSTHLDVTSNDTVALVSCIDGYITSETGAPANLDYVSIGLHGDKTIMDLHISGATVDGQYFFSSVVKDLEVFPNVYICKNRERLEIESTMTTKSLTEFMDIIDFRQLDNGFPHSSNIRYQVIKE